MRYIFKFISIIIIATVIFINYLFAGVSLMEGYNLYSPYIDTELAPNFTIKKSKQIKIGKSKNDVIKILGNPLSKSKSYKGYLMYSYTSNGLLHKTKKHNSSSICDFAWFGFDIFFDNQNKVIDIQTGWRYN